MEVPLNIKTKETLLAEVARLLKRQLDLTALSWQENELMRIFAKTGLLDLCFALDEAPDYEEVSGTQTLRDNGLADRDDPFKSENGDNLKVMLAEMAKGKHYLKVFATATEVTGSWLSDKTYLVLQMVRGEEIIPLPKDEVQTFRVVDMCFTNYPDIWAAKHFYA